MVKRPSLKITKLKRGDIILISLDPVIGHEQSGYRPVLIISDSIFHKNTGFAFCVPMTSKVKNLLYEIVIDTEKIKGALLPHALRSVDLTSRKFKMIDHVDESIINKVFLILSKIIG